MAEQAFTLSVGLLENLLKHIVHDQPHEKLSIVLKSKGSRVVAFVQPAKPGATPVEVDQTQDTDVVEASSYIGLDSANVAAASNESKDSALPLIHPLDPTAPNTDQATNSETAPKIAQSSPKMTMFELDVENYLDGERVFGPIDFSPEEKIRKTQQWSVKYKISKSASPDILQHYRRINKTLLSMSVLNVPEGKTVSDMYASASAKPSLCQPKLKWKEPDARIVELRKEAKASGEEFAKRSKKWATEGVRTSWTPPHAVQMKEVFQRDEGKKGRGRAGKRKGGSRG